MKSIIPIWQSGLWQQADLLTNFSSLSWTSSLGNENLKCSIIIITSAKEVTFSSALV